MSAILIEGKKVSEEYRQGLKEQIIKKGIKPGLATILAGDDPASKVYIKWKIKACQDLGIYSEHYDLDAGVTGSTILKLISKLNKDKKIDGILLQLPLPKGLIADDILNTIDPQKDVDCFHPVNVGKFFIAKTWEEMLKLEFLPCTPYGIMELLRYYDIDVHGKEAVVIGRSNIVGKPLGLMLLGQNATVSYCHSKTMSLDKFAARADILVAAIGKPNFVTGDFVKNGAVVIDVGTNRTDNGLCGDVDFASVKDKASYLTPVPGGVGPMTITMLMRNTVNAALRRA